jgi:hypothetical protein
MEVVGIRSNAPSSRALGPTENIPRVLYEEAFYKEANACTLIAFEEDQGSLRRAASDL